MEDDFDEIDGQNNGDELIESDVVFLGLQKAEVVVDDVFDLVLIQSEDFLKDLLNLI